eukprot:gene12267-26219_t
MKVTLLLACFTVGGIHAKESRTVAETAALVEKLRAEYVWPSGEEAAGGVDEDQFCTVNRLAYSYGKFLKPELGTNVDLFDALELATRCGMTRPAPSTVKIPSYPVPSNAVFVDPLSGTDSAPGSQSAPFKTVAHAIAIAGSTKKKNGTPAAVVLRAGVHYLSTTLQIGQNLSGLTLQNYPGEEAWISGGVPITAAWTKATGLPAKGAATANVWKTQAASGTTQEHGLLNSQGVNWLKPKGWGQPGFNLSRTSPASDEAAGACGEHFTYGVGGWSCSRYTPAGGFWCSNQSTGGGSGWELMVPGAPLFPVGLTVEAGKWGAHNEMPAEPSTWKKKNTAVVETWTNGWSTTFWQVDDIIHDQGGNSSTLVFGNGGQQSGRGFHIDPPTTPPKDLPISTEGGWKIENALELLDVAEEWYFDADTKELYLGWVVPQLKELIRIEGDSAHADCTACPSNISILGVGFRDAMAAWGKTSDIEGGDDSLHHLPPGVGIDGTGGTQPRYTRVLGNVVREIGMNERQSSA